MCVEHDISRKSFYELRKRARTEGAAAVLEPRTRRPASSPSRLSEEVKAQAVQVRAALEASGLDHGPISVHDKMRTMGLPQVPSTAALARVFRQAGVARLEPRKKPRSAWRRFGYPAPNACWQLDATEYVLTGGRRCVIFQLIDDHSRYALASHVVGSETAQAAIAVFDRAVAAHGVPQRLLSDNGLALNPSRRGHVGRLQAQVDAFDHLYNTQRPHQGLPGRATPAAAWAATPKTDAPRPRLHRPAYARPDPRLRPAPPPPDLVADLPADTTPKRLSNNGTFMLDSVHYKVGGQHGYQQVLVVLDGDRDRRQDHRH